MLATPPTREPDAGIPTQHGVRFYDEDQQLMNEVEDFLDEALRAGGHAVVIATRDHCSELARRLGGMGQLRTGAAAWHPGTLVLLDAAETLDRVMIDNQPDRDRFESVLVPVLQRGSGDKPLHAFGEMVTLLCDQGNYAGALALETLWNDLVRRHRFSLLCGYPWRLFSSTEQVRAFQHVCAAHGRVLDGSSAVPDVAADPARTLVQLQQQALVLQTEVQRRRQAEQTLRQRERELADFLDNASEGIHKVAADGTILYANRAELDLLGYRWEEYVGRNIGEFYAEAGQIQSILHRLARGEVLRDEPALLRCKDGSHKPVLICSNGLFEDGKLVYTRCFTRDATERVARDQALEQRDNVILQAPMGAALLSGPALRIELANAVFCGMLGETDLVGKSFAEAFPHLVGSRTEAMLHKVLASGEPCSTDEYRAVLGRGPAAQEHFYKVALQPLRAPGGEVQGIVVVAFDVTDQVLARQALEQAAREREGLLANVREASRAKDEFLAMLGHELRNPLSPIVTALQLMRLRGDTGTTREQAIIQRQVDHLTRLVDDLLDISRVTRGTVELRRERCELSPVLTKAVEQASILLEQRRHQLHIDIAPDLHCHCDPVRVAQVVANLLTNAARYTEPGGTIRLRAWQDGPGFLAISVRDNGNGIAADRLPKVFDLFYQGDRGVDRAEGGLGIGLAIVRSLVELHGGTVHAHSDGPGRGSEFVVRLPAVAASPVGIPDGAQPATPVTASVARRVLLVDDNVDAVEVMGELLRANGHQVTVFTDPASALLALPALQPELAVLDIGLPVMDGYELAARIRDTCGDACRLVALTGYGQETDRTRTQAAGFDAHLVKPVSHERLLEIIQALG